MRYVLVTGCDSGFGKDIVSALLNRDQALQNQDPEEVIYPIACYHSEERLSWAKLTYPAMPSYLLDITSDESVSRLRTAVERLVNRDTAKSHQLIGLANNAGGFIGSAGPAEWTSIDVLSKQMDLNFIGTVRVTKALLPFLRKSKGRIVNVSSLMGIVAAPWASAYVASKYALEGWSDCLRRELMPFAVRVHVIEPGMCRATNFYRSCLHYTERSPDHTLDSVAAEYLLAYGDEYARFVSMRLDRLHSVISSCSTEEVVNAAMHALFSKWPKHRYKVGFDTWILGTLLQVLPTSIADLAIVFGDALMNITRAVVLPTRGLKSVGQVVWSTLIGYQQVWLLVIVLIVIVVLL